MTKINKEKETRLPVTLLKELLRYEYETGLFYWLKKSHPKANSIKAGQIAGCLKKDGYIHITINNYAYTAHRLAWGYVHGDYPQGEQPYIDHINGRRNDNRIENLKVSSHAENSRNKKMLSSNISTINGVNRYVRTFASGKTYTYWKATWYNEDGKRKQKDFPVNTYGEDESKQAAVDYRAEQIRLLKINFGIKYSDRYGT